MDPAEIKRLWDAAENAPHSQAKGRAYEDHAAYLFGCVPGCMVERDITNIFGTEQIDLAVGNLGLPTGLAPRPCR